jgi:hypothetical protein
VHERFIPLLETRTREAKVREPFDPELVDEEVGVRDVLRIERRPAVDARTERSEETAQRPLGHVAERKN